MVHSAAAFAWFGGIAVAEGATVPTLNVANGVCYTLPLWKSRPAQMAYGIWFSLSFYVIILSTFVFCYGRILVIIRRQSRVMAAHGAPGSSGAQTTQLNRIQLKIIKTIVGIIWEFSHGTEAELWSVLRYHCGTYILVDRTTTEARSALWSMLRSVLRFRVRVKVKVRIRVRVFSRTTDRSMDRILVIIRRQSRVMAARGAPGSSGAQTTELNSIQLKIIKTMILVSVLFAITWTPSFVVSFLMNIHGQLTLSETGFYATVFVGFIYTCTNPFIYATNFDPVNQVLVRLISCNKAAQPPNEDIEMALQ